MRNNLEKCGCPASEERELLANIKVSLSMKKIKALTGLGRASPLDDV